MSGRDYSDRNSRFSAKWNVFGVRMNSTTLDYQCHPLTIYPDEGSGKLHTELSSYDATIINGQRLEHVQKSSTGPMCFSKTSITFPNLTTER